MMGLTRRRVYVVVRTDTRGIVQATFRGDQSEAINKGKESRAASVVVIRENGPIVWRKEPGQFPGPISNHNGIWHTGHVGMVSRGKTDKPHDESRSRRRKLQERSRHRNLRHSTSIR